MRFSLLYKDFNEEENQLIDDMSNAVYDLSIDKAVSAFCRNTESYNYFMEVLKNPLKTVGEIRYRQDILMDFIALPKLLDELRLIFKSYDTLQSDFHEMRSGVYAYGAPNTVRGILDSTYESLRVTAGFARNTVSYFRSVHDTIASFEVKSEGLNGIKRFCAEMTENESLDEISTIASYFARDTIEAYEFKVLAETDSTLTIRSASLTEVTELESRTLGGSLRKLFGSIAKGTQSSADIPEIDMGEFHLDDAQNILSEALYDIFSALSGITGNIYEFFHGLSGELSFYDTGLKYCRYLSSAQMPMCMPHILEAEADSFKANGLYDIQLILEGLGSEEIVSNSVRLDSSMDGLLLRGPNSCGKTSYLRALGSAQIFAQSGLPVCASAASISVRTGVFTQFSSSEKDFFAGDIAGRFEGEVKDVAKILDRVTPYSMVLLNETFQTTSYSEGAEGMRYILERMPFIDVKYCFVTRLLQLFETLDPAKVKMLEFRSVENGDFYTICELTNTK